MDSVDIMSAWNATLKTSEIGDLVNVRMPVHRKVGIWFSVDRSSRYTVESDVVEQIET